MNGKGCPSPGQSNVRGMFYFTGRSLNKGLPGEICHQTPSLFLAPRGIGGGSGALAASTINASDAVSMALSRRCENTFRGRPGGMGFKNSTMMVPGVRFRPRPTYAGGEEEGTD